MWVIIAGSRTITDYAVVCEAIKASGFEITKVISGCCQGVDKLGERWAKENDIEVAQFPAPWRKYGKAAGPMRNSLMATVSEALIAVVAPGSRGTLDMIEKARKKGLKIHIHAVGQEDQTK